MMRFLLLLIQVLCFSAVEHIAGYGAFTWQFWAIAGLFLAYNVATQLYREFKERDEFFEYWWQR